MSIEELSVNTTLYVRGTGDDDTGDGTSGDPYATVGRAIERIKTMWFGDYTLTIDVGEGVFPETSFRFQHPQGSQLYINGVSEDHSSISVASIDGSLSYDATSGWYFYEVWFQFPSPVLDHLALNDHIMVRSASGGTNPKTLRGCHQIVSHNTTLDQAKVRVFVCSYDEVESSESHPLPSGNITCDLSVIRTNLSFTEDSYAVRMEGPYHGGNWNHLCFYEGQVTAFDIQNHASILLGSRCGVADWPEGVWADNNATVFADYAYFSKINNCGIQAVRGSTVSVRGAVFSGVKDSTLLTQIGHVAADGAMFVCCSGESDPSGDETSDGYILDAQHRGVIDAPSVEIIYPTGWAFGVSYGGYINVTSLSLTSDYDASEHSYDTVVNDRSYINN